MIFQVLYYGYYTENRNQSFSSEVSLKIIIMAWALGHNGVNPFGQFISNSVSLGQ